MNDVNTETEEVAETLEQVLVRLGFKPVACGGAVIWRHNKCSLRFVGDELQLFLDGKKHFVTKSDQNMIDLLDVVGDSDTAKLLGL